MSYKREDFEEKGSTFTPENFKKGDVLWHIGKPIIILSDWRGEKTRLYVDTSLGYTYWIDDFNAYYYKLKTNKMDHIAIQTKIRALALTDEQKAKVEDLMKEFGYIPPSPPVKELPIIQYDEGTGLKSPQAYQDFAKALGHSYSDQFLAVRSSISHANKYHARAFYLGNRIDGAKWRVIDDGTGSFVLAHESVIASPYKKPS